MTYRVPPFPCATPWTEARPMSRLELLAWVLRRARADVDRAF